MAPTVWTCSMYIVYMYGVHAYEHNVINTYMYMYVGYQSPKKNTLLMHTVNHNIVRLGNILCIYTCTPVHKLYDCNKDLSLSLSL